MNPRFAALFALSTCLFGSTSEALAGWPPDRFVINVNGDGGFIDQTFFLRNGRVELLVKRQSVSVDTVAYATDVPLAPHNPFLLPQTVVALGRPNLSLSKAASLYLSYTLEELPAGTAEANLRVHTLRNHKWVLVGGAPDTVNKRVAVNISTGGVYAVLASTSNTANSDSILCHKIDGEGAESHYVLDGSPFRGGPDSPWPFYEIKSLQNEFLHLTSPAYSAILSLRRQPAGTFELYTSNPDGSYDARITSLSMQSAGPGSFRQDGRMGIFPAVVAGQTNIYKMNIDGSGLTTLASGLAAFPVVAINPAGTQAAYSTNNSVVIVDPTTNAVLRTAVIPGAVGINAIAYNANGTLIAVAAEGLGLFTVNPVNAGVVARVAGFFTGPIAFSPDGAFLALRTQNRLRSYRLSNNTLVKEWGSSGSTSDFSINMLFWR